MKKIFLSCFMLLSLISCSSDDDSGTRVQNLAPPSWLLGDWRYLVSSEGGNENLTNDGYNFIINDVCEVYSITTICFKSTYGNESNFYLTEYKKNDSEYKFSVTIGNETKQYSFSRIDQNRIKQLEGVDYPNAVLEKI